jgi:hypothetical protein
MRRLALVVGRKIGDTRGRYKVRTACDLKLQVDEDPAKKRPRQPCALPHY